MCQVKTMEDQFFVVFDDFFSYNQPLKFTCHPSFDRKICFFSFFIHIIWWHCYLVVCGHQWWGYFFMVHWKSVSTNQARLSRVGFVAGGDDWEIHIRNIRMHCGTFATIDLYICMSWWRNLGISRVMIPYRYVSNSHRTRFADIHIRMMVDDMQHPPTCSPKWHGLPQPSENWASGKSSLDSSPLFLSFNQFIFILSTPIFPSLNPFTGRIEKFSGI